jgi:hypothetical protein
MSVPEQGRVRSSFAAARHRVPRVSLPFLAFAECSVDSRARPGNGFGMNKRLAMLEKLTASAAADSFAFYCLGLEYRKEGRVDEALSAFGTLRTRDAGYLPMYLMAGQMLREAGRLAEAASWLTQGIELASQKNDSKALGELESELASVQSG